MVYQAIAGVNELKVIPRLDSSVYPMIIGLDFSSPIMPERTYAEPWLIPWQVDLNIPEGPRKQIEFTYEATGTAVIIFTDDIVDRERARR